MPVKKHNLVVWFSCGAASAVAAKKTIEIYSNTFNVIVVNNPVDEEHPDNKRFLKDVEKWIGQPIVSQINTKLGHTSAFKVWEDRKYMSGIKGAPCTMLLKKGARYDFELNNEVHFHVLGFTYDEKARHERFVKFERANVLPVLIDLKITKSDCFQILLDSGIKLPFIYSLGYPNANCIGCPKSQSPTYWNLVRKTFPEVFNIRAFQSRNIGARLVRYKGKRIFLDELPVNAIGSKIKSFDCGIFCDTK